MAESGRSNRTAFAFALALAVAALMAWAAVSAPRSEAATEHCSATFTVLHDDRIGQLKLKAGEYDVTLLDPAVITCAKASQLFAKFLQDYDGNLPDGWKLNVARAQFSKGGGFGFRVAPAAADTGHGGQHPAQAHSTCPTFRVLNDDQIDRVSFAKGTYQMTALGGLACKRASNIFARFLSQNQTSLPGSWKLDAKTGTFTRGRSGQGFQVNFWR